VALLICCSARNTAHVGDLYPASSNSSVRFVSFRIIVISACSWPSQHSCVFRKFHPPLVIVHFRPGSRHVVRSSVVMILVSTTRSSHTCDESWILTKPPAEISWSRNQFFPITSKVSCSRRRPGLYADVAVNKTTSQNLWPRRRFFCLRRQPQNFENMKLVARRRKLFQVFLAIFLVAQLSPKRGALVQKNSLASCSRVRSLSFRE